MRHTIFVLLISIAFRLIWALPVEIEEVNRCMSDHDCLLGGFCMIFLYEGWCVHTYNAPPMGIRFRPRSISNLVLF